MCNIDIITYPCASLIKSHSLKLPKGKCKYGKLHFYCITPISDTTWRYISGSTWRYQAITWTNVLWHSPRSISQKLLEIAIHKMSLENGLVKWLTHLQSQWVKNNSEFQQLPMPYFIAYPSLIMMQNVIESLGSHGLCNTIRTLHDCPSQMNENLLISNSKLTSDSELIWWR